MLQKKSMLEKKTYCDEKKYFNDDVIENLINYFIRIIHLLTEETPPKREKRQ